MDKEVITIDELLESLNACIHGDDCEKCIGWKDRGEQFCWMNLMRKTVEVLEPLKHGADVRPVVACADCEYNNACLTQAFVEEEGRIPFDRNTFFCADGKRAADV